SKLYHEYHPQNTYYVELGPIYKLFVSCNKHHPNLAIRALFMSHGTLTPRPPSTFGLHILSQETRCCPLPHTKLLASLLSFTSVHACMTVVLIVCTGIDDRTAFVIVTLPGKLNVCFFHPDSREATFSSTSQRYLY